MNLLSEQKTLAGLQTRLSDRSHTAVGKLGEETAAALLARSGYQVVTTEKRGHCGDRLAIDQKTGEMFKVEVKTARQGKQGWQFCLRKNDKHGQTDVSDADFLMLLAVLKSGRVVVFVIPVSELGDIGRIAFRTHPEDYQGRFAPFRVNGRNPIKLEKKSVCFT